jgi:cytochrome c nitrite reductase small subunit
MKKLIDFITPPKSWQMTVFIIFGVLVGLTAYTLKVSNAVSYLSDSPETCINCHVMTPQYATWNHSSHRQHATCNDCHVPQDNIISKYYFKASDGLRHATMFTLKLEPQTIRIKDAGAKVVQENCKRCHAHLNSNVSIKDHTFEDVHKGNGRFCWDCHREVPHGKVRSLSATPNSLFSIKRLK